MKKQALPQLVAHRGYSARYPENTLLSLEQALLAGACYLECDVQLTRDKVPMLVHDHMLQRTTGNTGNIHEITYEQVRLLNASYAQRFGYRYQHVVVPDVKQLVGLMQRWPNRRVFVELKRASIRHFGRQVMLDAVSKILRPIQRQVVLISFDADIVKLAQTCTDYQTGWVFDHWKSSALTTAKEANTPYVFVDWECVPDDMEVLPQIPGQWVVYEIDDAQAARHWIEKGAAMIETNDIAALLASPFFKDSRCDD
jgi:glycerophosphoryl diester phosphodiesterase